MESEDPQRRRPSTSRNRASRNPASRNRASRNPASRNALAVVLAVTFLLVVCGVAAGAGTLLSSRAVAGPSGRLNARTSGSSPGKLHPPRQAHQLRLPRGHGAPVPSWVWLILLGALLAAAIVVAVVVLRDRLGSGTETEPVEAVDFEPAAERASLQAGVAAALADLDEEADPRDGVVACWLRLEASLQDRHAGRAPAETSAELARRVLAAYDVDPRALNGLHRSYQIARFSTEPVNEAMRDRARSALQVVSRQLGRARAETDPPAMSPIGQ